LYGRILTSPHAHAIIRDIDVSAAKALPGVHAVLTYKDVPRVPYSGVEGIATESRLRDQYSLDYIMRYVGDRVAIVAAETPDVAEQALSLIEVDYEVLPAIFDPRQALEPNAPHVHPESEAVGVFDATRNIAARVRTEVGDVERGFSESDVVVEEEYTVPAMQQAPLENHNVITYFDEDGCLVVRTSTQAPHHIRRTLARILNLPVRRIRVVKPAVGGGLGVKQEIVLEDLAALLTIATNRPVMFAFSRAEEFSSGRLRQHYVVRIKTGVKRDGAIIANQIALLTSTGAYGTHPLIAQKSATETLALYPCPHMRYVAEVLYTNTPPSGAMRGYGTPQEFFALESHMDEIAKRLNMDALELRRKNWLKAGDEYPWQKALSKNKDMASPIMSCGLPECTRIVEEKLNWRSKRGRVGNGHTRQGVGMALSLHGNYALNNGTSGAMIKLNEDGSFDVFAGVSDSENGASTLLTQIVAESIGVPIETIILHISQTDTAPTDIGENASSALYLSGGAMKKAAEQIRRQLLAVGGRMLNIMPENLKIANGFVTASGVQSLSMEQIAEYSLYTENRHIMTTASWKMPYTPITFAAQGVEIEVDTETGSIRILKAVVAVDAGRVINPQILEGHVQAAVAQGLGGGLVEEVLYDQKGALLTTNLADYHIYSTLDMPEVQTYLVETVDPAGPFGAKVVADAPLYGMAPAIANAVADALGIRMRQAPLTPERILRAIHAHAQAQAQVQATKR
jgi:putative selenate reductase molybdopterin-binding subunit